MHKEVVVLCDGEHSPFEQVVFFLKPEHKGQAPREQVLLEAQAVLARYAKKEEEAKKPKAPRGTRIGRFLMMLSGALLGALIVLLLVFGL